MNPGKTPGKQSWQALPGGAKAAIIVAAALAVILFLCCGLAACGAILVDPQPKTDNKGNHQEAPQPAQVTTPPPVPATTQPAPPPPTTAAPVPTTAPPAPPVPTPAAPKTTAPAPVYYANCDAVRAAGKAPLYRNSPGYRAALDADNDGIACETDTNTGGGGTGGGGGGSAPVYYANCDAVRAAGKAPLYRGQPGYRDALDRDKDGIACE
ncbi:excalibur calcium-binding domain-containing protein [Longispora albida]|uniref:excalibur calcium-binding domain-containing protein n=1 Tax=Longispora albida TaxID=203523 RepID=UPI00035FDBF5|nr:excalibur calcium-binding domain-containing protein [Longispora albida]